jgi:spermidine synthase
MAKRSRRRTKTKSSTVAPALPESVHIQVEQPQRRGIDWILIGVVACFVLSGFAALLYQTAWLRQFSIAFGTSELAVATVLAAYMAGLALGAGIAARYVDRVTRPVLVYGLLEAGIAISALAVPWLLVAAGALYTIVLGDQPAPPDAASVGQSAYYLVIAFLILAIPTGFMGATLPLLIRHVVQSNAQLGPRVAMLYASNTIGAVFGTVVAGFVLLPALGLHATVWVGVAVNFIVFLIAARLARYLRPLDKVPVSALNDGAHMGFVHCCVKPWFSSSATLAQKTHTVFSEQAAWILPIMLLSGSNAFYYEVLWTRLINHVLGGSIYAFATMLASFLSGIAIGGAFAGRFARTREQAAWVFAVVQIAIGLSSVAVYTWMEHAIPNTRELLSDAIFAAIVMLPATIFIGATLPLAVRILSLNEHDAGTGTARVYSWNTVGAIFGAVLAGFYLIPLLGFEGSIRLAVVINLLLCLLTLITLTPRRLAYVVVVAVLTLGVVAYYQPERPLAVINVSAFASDDDYNDSSEVYFAVGRSATVLMAAKDGWMNLRTNGLAEALIDAKGAPPTLQNQRWLTALPVAARPDAESLLVIGFGGGVALEGAPHSVKDIDVIELEPKVIEANRAISSFRSRDPLADERVSIIINDARNALRLSSKRYDIIVSQPSHPWTAGASHLYTREFMSIAKDHLRDDGVFVQWMNTEFVDEELLRTLAATLIDVFSNVRAYQPNPGALFFLASDAELKIEHEIARTGRPLNEHVFHYAQLGLNSIEDFVVSLALDERGLQGFAQGGSISTDNLNMMATRSRSRGDGLTPNNLFELFAPYDPLLNNDSWIYTELGGDLNYAYIGSRLIHNGFVSRANKLKNSISDRSTALLLHATNLSYHGKSEDALKYLRASIRERPSNLQARFAMVKNRLASVVAGTASEETKAVARSLTGVPKAVIEGWGYAATQNWLELVELEERLAASEPTDIWYPEATQLRVEWRTKVTAEGMERKLALDALKMADRALLISPDLDLYVLRAVCGLMLKDPYVFVESSRYVAGFIEIKLEHAKNGDYEMSAGELEVMRSRIRELSSKLNLGFVEPIRQRALETQKSMNLLADRLKNFKANR